MCNVILDIFGIWLWGWGVLDCKNLFLGIYGVVEWFVIEGYKLECIIIIFNGYDEEVSFFILCGSLI